MIIPFVYSALYHAPDTLPPSIPPPHPTNLPTSSPSKQNTLFFLFSFRHCPPPPIPPPPPATPAALTVSRPGTSCSPVCHHPLVRPIQPMPLTNCIISPS